MKDTMSYLEERKKNDRSFTFELIIVDDGSPDKTSEVKTRFVFLSTNFIAISNVESENAAPLNNREAFSFPTVVYGVVSSDLESSR